MRLPSFAQAGGRAVQVVVDQLQPELLTDRLFIFADGSYTKGTRAHTHMKLT